jgi:hypothetical protein
MIARLCLYTVGKSIDSRTFEGCNYGLQPASIEDQAIIIAKFGVEPGKNCPE